jgi:anti-sigma-K factor RskA
MTSFLPVHLQLYSPYSSHASDKAISQGLTAVQIEALRVSPKVAVSLEPDGGSRTGTPTGPVLFVADLQVAASG